MFVAFGDKLLDHPGVAPFSISARTLRAPSVAHGDREAPRAGRLLSCASAR
jgi:hypothetical protein